MRRSRFAAGRSRCTERHVLRRPARRVLIVVVVLLAVLGIADRAGLFGWQGDDYSRYDGRTFLAAKVVDGDTIDIAVPDRGRPHTRVRLWGVDTPEVGGHGRRAEPFGAEASVFTRQTVLNRQVRVELSRERTRDRYGRLLAYVYLSDGGEMLNELLISTGRGYADRRFEHEFQARFWSAEDRARKAGAGLWASAPPDQPPEPKRRMDGGSEP